LITAVDDGVSGLLVASRDSRSFADAIERLVRNPRLWADLSAGARMHASAFGWSATTSGLLDSYSAAMSNHSALAHRVASGS